MRRVVLHSGYSVGEEGRGEARLGMRTVVLCSRSRLGTRMGTPALRTTMHTNTRHRRI